jgi:hypothetical protein
VLVLGVVEVQGAGESVEHGGAGAGLLAAFQADVVVDADAGERGQFLAAQTGGAASARAYGEADLVGARLGAPRVQEPAQLAVAAPVCALLGCHGVSVTPR